MTMYVKECATTSATAYLILYATSDLTSSDDGRTHAGGGGDPSVGESRGGKTSSRRTTVAVMSPVSESPVRGKAQADSRVRARCSAIGA